MPSTNHPTLITLTGTYRSSNRGDAAMQLVALEQLSRAGRRVVVDSPFPEHDAALYGTDRVVHCGRRSGPRIAVQTVLAAVVGLLRRLRVSAADRLLLTEELRSLGTRNGIVVDLSGDMLTEDYGFVVGFGHFVPLVQAMFLGTPVVVCAQSIGPFNRLSPLARWVLRRCAAITLRDEISVEHLRGFGVRPEVTADVAFLLPSWSEEGHRVLERAGVEGPFVAVSVSPILEARYESTGADESFAAVVAGVLDRSVPEDLGIVFVPHVTGPGPSKDDRLTASRVAAQLERHSAQLVEEMDPRTTKGVIGQATAIVGCRMHANIAALSQRVPTLALSYSHKSAGIMDRLGVGGRVVDGRDLERQLEAAVRDLMASLASDRDQLARHVPAATTMAARNFEVIEDLLAARAGSTRDGRHDTTGQTA